MKIISKLVKDPDLYWYEFDYENQPLYTDEEGVEIPVLSNDIDRKRYNNLWHKVYALKIIQTHERD